MRAKPPTRSRPTTKSEKIKKKKKISKKKLKSEKKDESILHQPVDTALDSMSELIKLFDSGSPEVKRLLDEECDIIYECKACRALFRSIPNFVTHKRCYCPELFNERVKAVNGEFKEHTLILGNQRPNMLSTRTTIKKDILALLDSVSNLKVDYNVNGPFIVREIASTSESLLNSFNHEGKQPTLERTATLGPDGRILGSKPSELAEVNCPFCNSNFGSQSGLEAHIQEQHLENKDYCTCPCCKRLFPNTWSVYRHMYRDHNKSSDQVRKLRSQIQKKLLNTEDAKAKKGPHPEEFHGSEKEWLQELVGQDLHFCHLCGKNIPKQAAMMSHLTECSRMASLHASNERKRPLKLSDPTPPAIIKMRVRTDYQKQRKSPVQCRIVVTPVDTSFPSKEEPSLKSSSLDRTNRLKTSNLESTIEQLHYIRLQNEEKENLESRREQNKQNCPVNSAPILIDISSDEGSNCVPKVEMTQASEVKEEKVSMPEVVHNELTTINLMTDSEQDEEQDNSHSTTVEPESTINDEEEETLKKKENVVEQNEYDPISSSGRSPSTNETQSSNSSETSESSSPNDWASRKVNNYIDAPKKKCLVCFKVFPRIKFVKRHVAEHLKIVYYKCKLCDFECYLREDILSHIRKDHKILRRTNRSEFFARVFPKVPLSDSNMSLEASDGGSTVIMTEDKALTNGHGDVNISSSSMELDLQLETESENSLDDQSSKDEPNYDDSVDNQTYAETTKSDENLRSLMMEVIFGTKPEGVQSSENS